VASQKVGVNAVIVNTHTFNGACYYTPHATYFAGTILRDSRPPEDPEYDNVLEIDVFGRKGPKPCLNNPDYRQYYQSLVEDQLRSYPIDGINFNIERYGPLENTLLGNFPSAYTTRKPSAATCFCPHCVRRAADRGIDVERARRGYVALLEFAEGSWLAGLQAGDALSLPGFPLGDIVSPAPPPTVTLSSSCACS
jgi:hypothetical protein